MLPKYKKTRQEDKEDNMDGNKIVFFLPFVFLFLLLQLIIKKSQYHHHILITSFSQKRGKEVEYKG